MGALTWVIATRKISTTISFDTIKATTKLEPLRETTPW